VAAAEGTAQWKPVKPVEFVVPVQAGGSLDQAARAIQQIWQERVLVTVPVSVVNKPGGGQSISASYVHQAPGDAHRIGLVSSALLSNHITGTSPLKHTDFSILGQLYTEYVVISVRAESPVTSGSDLIARLKPAPDALSVAVGSARGTTSHFGLAVPLKRSGVDVRRMRTVVFPSAPASITSLLGGHVDIVTGPLAVADPHWRAGKLRILAVTAPQRLPGDYAKIPTWREQGIDSVVSNWRFIVAPPGLTEEPVRYWDEVFRRTVATPEWHRLVEKYNWVDEYLPSREGRKYLEQQDTEQREMLTELGLAK
jgi:putative tricarboxylic transport membrane protein